MCKRDCIQVYDACARMRVARAIIIILRAVLCAVFRFPRVRLTKYTRGKKWEKGPAEKDDSARRDAYFAYVQIRLVIYLMAIVSGRVSASSSQRLRY